MPDGSGLGDWPAPRSDPEIFIGLVGALGTDMTSVIGLLEQGFRAVAYAPIQIKLSELIGECARFRTLRDRKGWYEDERIESYMNAGDQLRRAMRAGDAVGRLAIRAICEVRYDKNQRCGNSESQPLPRTVYILNSLKHPDELRLFRDVYGAAFYALSIYQDKESRIEQLSNRIAKSYKQRANVKFREKAELLIMRDEKDPEDKLGQGVRDTFPLSDYFVTQSSDLRRQVSRFINLLFGAQFTTPTIDECGMFHASAAALRSSDLSRQVGAAILTDRGEIVATGCNEVPAAGGGAVWERVDADPENDYRDFQIGHDANALVKRDLLKEIFEVLKNGWLSESRQNRDAGELADELLHHGDPAPLEGTRVAALVEFGRIVHAEMFALAEAARRGVPVDGATLYTTTFPCHMCARHIIAAGIQKVVYIEPYPKSMAKELYGKSIKVAGECADENAVEFCPFSGVAPRSYLGFFTMTRRKDDRGYALPKLATAREPQPRFRVHFPSYLDFEEGVLAFLKEHAVEFGLLASDE